MEEEQEKREEVGGQRSRGRRAGGDGQRSRSTGMMAGGDRLRSKSRERMAGEMGRGAGADGR